jgi:hypothetical protein
MLNRSQVKDDFVSSVARLAGRRGDLASSWRDRKSSKPGRGHYS